jgi:PAS domain S-box-containing protein
VTTLTLGNNLNDTRLLRHLIDSFPDHIYVKDTDSRFLMVNVATARFLGAATADDVIGKTDFDFFSRELAERFRAEEVAVFQSVQMLVNREAAVPGPSGNTMWVLTTKVPLRDDRGQVVGLLGVNRDITERKRTEEQVLKLSHAVEQSATLVVICNTQGDIEYINPKFAEVTGYAPEEIIGKNVRILKSGHTSPEEYVRLWETLSAGRQWRGQFHNKRKNGEFYWVSANISPIKNGGGVVTHYVSVQEDITERKQIESQLRQLNENLARKQQELLGAMEELKAAQTQLIDAEKMETIGRLAAGVAHEVKNPLAIMRLGVDYISGALPEEKDDVKLTLADMTAALVRADAVVGGLLDLAAAHEVSRQPVDLHATLEQCLTLLHHAATRAHVRTVREFAKQLPQLHLDRLKIEQVFINLILNGIQAMTDGGTLTVRTHTRQIAPDESIPEPGDRSGERLRVGDTVAVVEIDDTGTGIPEDKLAKVFDPFFTTKATGKGTGLGLTVSKKIIEIHGGTVNIRNRTEGGVRVTVMLKT